MRSPVLCAAAVMLMVGAVSCSPRGSGPDPVVARDQAPTPFDEGNPLGANAACYVCHMTFVKEDLARTHLAAKITCVRCHGLSAGHANDEDIGATKPDVTFSRDRVPVMCLECHDKHEIAPEKAKLVCTDCHGKHRIEQAAFGKE